jgi:hypothetical protein
MKSLKTFKVEYMDASGIKDVVIVEATSVYAACNKAFSLRTDCQITLGAEVFTGETW